MQNKVHLNILALAGASGSGKTYIRNRLCSLSETSNKCILRPCHNIPTTFHAPIQCTTREKRVGENCLDYVFINKDEYRNLNNTNQLTARTHFNDNDYGTLVQDLVFNEFVVNIIPVNIPALNDLKYYKQKIVESIECDSSNIEINLETALIRGTYDENYMEMRNRKIETYKDELFNLSQIDFDYYISNFKNEEGNYALNEVIIAEKLGYEVYDR